MTLGRHLTAHTTRKGAIKMSEDPKYFLVIKCHVDRTYDSERKEYIMETASIHPSLTRAINMAVAGVSLGSTGKIKRHLATNPGPMRFQCYDTAVSTTLAEVWEVDFIEDWIPITQ